jgi:hypothetical protein
MEKMPASLPARREWPDSSPFIEGCQERAGPVKFRGRILLYFTILT